MVSYFLRIPTAIFKKVFSLSKEIILSYLASNVQSKQVLPTLVDLLGVLLWCSGFQVGSVFTRTGVWTWSSPEVLTMISIWRRPPVTGAIIESLFLRTSSLGNRRLFPYTRSTVLAATSLQTIVRRSGKRNSNIFDEHGPSLATTATFTFRC